MSFLYFFYNMSAKLLTLRRIKRDIITNVHWASGKATVILVRFEQNLNCLKRIRKILKHEIS